MKIVTVDCGISGGIATFNAQTLISVVPMPTTRKNRMDMIKIEALFKDADYIVVEEQFAPHGKNQKGGKTTLMNYGVIEGLAYKIGKDAVIVHPKTWQLRHGIKGDKEKSVRLANKIYGLDLVLKQDGLADAIMIGEWYTSSLSEIPF